MIKEEWDVSTGAPHQRLSNLGGCQSHLEGLLRDIQGPAPDFSDACLTLFQMYIWFATAVLHDL